MTKEQKREYSRKYYYRHREEYLSRAKRLRPSIREKLIEKCRRWRKKNWERHLAYSYRWRKENPDKWKSIIIKCHYGISLSEYNVMLKKQNGVCFICGGVNPFNSRWKKRPMLHVDHNHSTNKVRGLLCSNCNNGLGCFKDNAALIKKAIGYLSLFDGPG